MNYFEWLRDERYLLMFVRIWSCNTRITGLISAPKVHEQRYVPEDEPIDVWNIVNDVLFGKVATTSSDSSIIVSPDPINHPPHYNQGSVECIDAIKSALGEEGFKAYCRGNAIESIMTGDITGAIKHLEKILETNPS